MASTGRHAGLFDRLRRPRQDRRCFAIIARYALLLNKILGGIFPISMIIALSKLGWDGLPRNESECNETT